MGLAPATIREIILVWLLLAGLFLMYGPDMRSQLQFASVPAPAQQRLSSSSNASVEQQYHDTRMNWDVSPVPQTKVVAHAPGWSIIDRLYIYKGVVYIVSNEPRRVPDLYTIYSKGMAIEPGPDSELARLPDETDIRIISTTEAAALFGSGAQILDGVTYFVNDSPQFVQHYYHWSAELWFGFWRTYSALDPFIPVSGDTTLPPPCRLVFNRLDAFRWRDYARMNQWVTRSSVPELTMEFIDDWDDRAKMGVPFVFERVVLADRSAAMHGLNYQRYQRTAAMAFGLPGSTNWWLTIRNNVIQFAGLNPVAVEVASTRARPVITYISRQKWGRRMLKPADHERLVLELRKIEAAYGYEVHIVEAEKMTRLEQLQLASRTTILMGVHGNGLTSLLWMKPTRRSTVMEFFYPGGFAHDYEWTTRALGMIHYGFWGSDSFTSPDLPPTAYPEGFQGNEIPLDGGVVAQLCIMRLSLEEDVDEG